MKGGSGKGGRPASKRGFLVPARGQEASAESPALAAARQSPAAEWHLFTAEWPLPGAEWQKPTAKWHLLTLQLLHNVSGKRLAEGERALDSTRVCSKNDTSV